MSLDPQNVAELRRLDALSPLWEATRPDGLYCAIIEKDSSYAYVAEHITEDEAALAVAARNALPLLLDERERLQKENERLRGALTDKHIPFLRNVARILGICDQSHIGADLERLIHNIETNALAGDEE